MFSAFHPLKANCAAAGELLYRLCPFLMGIGAGVVGGGVVERRDGVGGIVIRSWRAFSLG
jgi:hypothetical protein